MKLLEKACAMQPVSLIWISPDDVDDIPVKKNMVSKIINATWVESLVGFNLATIFQTNWLSLYIFV